MNPNPPVSNEVPLVQVYDTTLRDGTQREGISYTLEDKLRIAEHLDAFGVAFIEGGWPGSNPKDEEFFARARDKAWKHAKIAAFGSTRRAGITPDQDPNIRALIAAGTEVCTIFGKSSPFQVSEVLRTTRDENLRMIEDSVAFLRSQNKRVVYDAEHFFDGYRADASYALETLRAAIRGGAEVVVLCETNGGNMPWDVEQIVADVVKAVNHPVGIHAHDDTGCGVANTLAAVRSGARHVQGTINGYGERCGNANLSVIIPNLELKLGLCALPAGKLEEISELSHFVAEVANLAPDAHMAYVGKSAFAHKGGVHVAALRRNPDSYQHIAPELVGNVMRVVVSELSGRGNVLAKAEELGVEVGAGSEIEALREIKEAEARGLSYEGAEASVALLLQRKAEGYTPLFNVIDYQVQVGKRRGTETFAEAVVKVEVGKSTLHTAAEGNGPVSALDAALRKALEPVYPAVHEIHLADYKVRILDGTEGAEAITRVLIDSQDAHRSWSTVGASPNIIEASMHALVDSIEYGLMQGGAVLPADAIENAPRSASRAAPSAKTSVEAGS
ncbi:MAG TPA: citramalate synthase [Polyangiaceae bacterium]|jgi:2-isopropylmalate synthase|nr:citramalate synthase [Polyangiaceae bacterium]